MPVIHAQAREGEQDEGEASRGDAAGNMGGGAVAGGGEARWRNGGGELGEARASERVRVEAGVMGFEVEVRRAGAMRESDERDHEAGEESTHAAAREGDESEEEGDESSDDATTPSYTSTDITTDGERADDDESESDSAVVDALVSMVMFYKSAISPLLAPACRFYPTCSSYCIESLREYGEGWPTQIPTLIIHPYQPVF